MSGLFTEDERRELRETLGEEMRELGLLDLPTTRGPSTIPAYAVDDEAEEQLLALAEVGQVAKISPKEFGRAFHALLFVIVSTCWANRKQPTLNRVLWLMHKDGWSSAIDNDVRRLMLEVPIRMTPNVAVRRVLEAARRRRMQASVGELDLLLRDVHTPNETIAKSLQKLIEVARGR